MQHKELGITQKDFDALGDYSMSLPTGATTGKRWKAKYQSGWFIGDYGEVVGTDILIKWYIPKIVPEEEFFLA